MTYGLGARPDDEACICCGTGQAAVMGRCYGCARRCPEDRCLYLEVER